MADPTIIDAGTRIDGRISGDADVTVQGRVDGEIALTQTLTVADGGLVRGTIRAHQTVVEGTIDGDIVADERIVLTATARMVGSLEAPTIQVEDGAQFSGEVIMELEAAGDARAPVRQSKSSQSTSSQSTSSQSTSSQSASSQSASSATPSKPTASGATSAAPATSSRTTTTTVAEAEEQASETDVTDLSTPQLEDYTVKELREELRDRDMQVSGTKDELIERLQDAGS
jgi:cytoskeletal protein CcmA (bactofilin family)